MFWVGVGGDWRSPASNSLTADFRNWSSDEDRKAEKRKQHTALECMDCATRIVLNGWNHGIADYRETATRTPHGSTIRNRVRRCSGAGG